MGCMMCVHGVRVEREMCVRVRAAPMWAGPQEAPRKCWRLGGVNPLLWAEPLVDGGWCDQTGFHLALMRSSYRLDM